MELFFGLFIILHVVLLLKGSCACAGGCLVYYFPKLINELNQSNSQLFFHEIPQLRGAILKKS